MIELGFTNVVSFNITRQNASATSVAFSGSWKQEYKYN
jgi:hypothetical protein